LPRAFTSYVTSTHEPAQGSTVALPVEVRVIGALLAFEIAAGLWFALNWPPGMSVFLSQIPAFGAVGMLWGFLPREPKDAFSSWFGARLRRPVVWISMTALFATMLGASCFVNTVVVSGAPNDPTWIHRHDGRAARSSTAGLAPADSQRLRRGTGPLYFWVWTSPVGRRVWLRSSTQLTPDELVVLPWRPTALEYPDSFESPAVLLALPGKQVLAELGSPTPMRMLVLEADGGDTLAVSPVTNAGAISFSFLDAAALSDADTATWRAAADSLTGGFDQDLLSFWKLQARGQRTTRALRADERVQVVVLDPNGKSVWKREVTLHAGTTTTLVAP